MQQAYWLPMCLSPGTTPCKDQARVGGASSVHAPFALLLRDPNKHPVYGILSEAMQLKGRKH